MNINVRGPNLNPAEWAQGSSPSDFWFWVIALAVLAGTGFIAGFIFFFRKRLLEDTPTSLIRSAAQGYVELAGHCELLEGPPIIAPLSGTTCTWYRYRIEHYRHSGKNNRWVTVRKGQSDELFLLRDETGVCVIDPEGARITTNRIRMWRGNTTTPAHAPAADQETMKSSGLVRLVTGNIGIGSVSGRYRYTEELMLPNDPLHAIGLFSTEGGASGNFDLNEDVRELLREWKQDSDAMLARFDHNKDGEICMEEWQAVRKAALEEVHKQHADEKVAMPTNMMGKTCDRRRPYILSALPESDLVRVYRLYYRAGIITFFISGTLATWLITLRLAG